jgi:DNA gyrase/topoisomerase IV subunit A
MREDDELIGVRLSDGEDGDILMVSRMGQAVRFSKEASARWAGPPPGSPG